MAWSHASSCVVADRRAESAGHREEIFAQAGHSTVAGMVMKTCCSIAALAAVMVGMTFSTMAAPPLVYAIENTGSNYPAPPLPTLANCPFIQPLPDPFVWANDPLNIGGTRGTGFSDWEHHRNEIKAQIENYEIGTKPFVNPANVTASYSGGAAPGSSGTLTVVVTNNTHTLTLTCAVSIPSGATAPYPITIGMDSPYGSLNFSDFTSRGIAGVTYSESQVSTYNNPQSTDPYYKLYPSLWGNSGQYSAWAWGVSRVIDGLTLVTNALPIDLNHICVTGCSYAGKLALFAGAFDERVALTIAQESGGGGDTSWRYSATEPTGTVEGLAQTSSQWFRSSMFPFGGVNVSYLPEDHHELMAMCAPRALYCTANTGYTWLSNPSAYVCGEACAQIYQTLGIADRFGFNVDGGHTHCAFPSDQELDLQYFLNKFMKGTNSLSQSIRTAPGSYSTIDYARWSAWWGTTNPAFPYSARLSLSLPGAATKGDGTLAGQGHVSVTPTPANDSVLVILASSVTNLVTVPASVVIPAGQSNAVFDLTIINNGLLEGDQSVTITATSQVCTNGPQNKQITVHDNETATLAVTLPASASESAGRTVNGSVSIVGATAGANVPVTLTSSDPSLLLLGTVSIPNGQSSAVFQTLVVDKNIIGGSENVSVIAHVANWTDGTASMTILFNDPIPAQMHFAWSAVPSPQTIGEPFPVTITAQDGANNTLDYQLPVTLAALIPGNAPGTNTILNSPSPEQSLTDANERVVGYSFTPSTNLKVTDVRTYFGDNVSIWTANGQLLASQNVASVPGTWVDTPLPAPLVPPADATYLVMAHENGAQYFYSQDLPTTFPDGTINQSWWDYGDQFPTQSDSAQWYFVDLRYATDFVSVPVNPGATANFSGGAWSGNVAALQAATNMMLQASAGVTNTGASNPFNVLGTPKLAIAALSNSVVLSWPASYTGRHLQFQTNPLTIGLSTNWVDIPGTDGSNSYSATLNNLSVSVFYRLAPQ
jgi:hypothetical protein